jgi:hypothetical protein
MNRGDDIVPITRGRMDPESAQLQLGYVPLRHVGTLGCGEIALYHDGYVDAAAPLDPAGYRLLDGSTPRPTDLVRCGSCGRRAMFYAADSGIETTHVRTGR